MMDKYFIILREKWIMQIDTSPKLVALITLPMLMLLFRDRDVPALFQEKILIKNPSRRLGSLRAAGILCSQSRKQNQELVVLPTSHQEAL